MKVNQIIIIVITLSLQILQTKPHSKVFELLNDHVVCFRI